MLGLRTVKSVISTVVKRSIKSLNSMRWALNLNGVNTFGQMPYKEINLDGDFYIEVRTPVDMATRAQTILSQNATGAFGSREFQVFTTSFGLYLLIGGTSNTVLTPQQGLKPSMTYGLDIVGDVLRVYEGGSGGLLVNTTNITRGTARESYFAFTKLGANTDNNANVNFFSGLFPNLKIGNKLWPISERGQTIHLPIPSELGPELCTPSVIATPSIIGSQWSYLGDGRWSLDGNGTYNEIIFIANPPVAFLLEFEVESISGGSIRCFSDHAANAAMTNHVVSSAGKYRFFTTNKFFSGNHYQSFVQHSGSVKCVIKNISMRSLYSVEPNSERINNGRFDVNIASWGGNNLSVPRWVNGCVEFSTIVGQQPQSRVEQAVTLIPGAWYLLTGNYIAGTNNTVAELAIIRNAAGSYRPIFAQLLTAPGRYHMVFKAPGSDAIVSLRGDRAPTANGTITMDNISLQRLSFVCNPLVLNNVVPEQWVEVSA